MIDEETLLSFRHFFADERQLEKDYLLNLMLKTISVNRASDSLEFKGGTALYLFHDLDRFSEDLDFTYIGKDAPLEERIDALIGPVVKDFGLSYSVSKEKGNVKVAGTGGKLEGTRTELFIEGPLFRRTGTRHKIKIDVSARDDTLMNAEAARFVSKYNDVGTVLLYKMPIEEMLTEKLCAIAERARARDLYDAYFLLKYKGVAYDAGALAEKFGKRREGLGVRDVLKSMGALKESAWKEELSYIVREMPGLDEARRLVGARMLP